MSPYLGHVTLAKGRWKHVANTQWDRHRTSLALVVDWAITQSSAASSLTFSPEFILYLCFCLSSWPSQPPSLSLPIPLSSLSQHVLSFEVTALTSQRCIIQQRRHTHADTNTDAAYTCMCVQLSVWLSICCWPLTDWSKLRVSHFSEWTSILVCYCFSMCVCRLHLCVACWAHTLAKGFILTPTISLACLLRADSHVTATHLTKGQRREEHREGGMETVIQPCPSLSLLILVVSDESDITSPVTRVHHH